MCLFQLARLQRLHSSGELDALNLDGPDPEGAAIVVASRRRIANKAKADREAASNLGKYALMSFGEEQAAADEARRLKRDDFCGFGGLHRGAATTLFVTPSLGWEAGADAQASRLLGESIL